MPKQSKDFPAQLSLQVTEEMRIALITIGYQTGNGGEYGPPARNLLQQAIRAYKEKLDARGLNEFKEIEANVRIMQTRKLPQENQKSPVV